MPEIPPDKNQSAAVMFERVVQLLQPTDAAEVRVMIIAGQTRIYVALHSGIGFRAASIRRGSACSDASHAAQDQDT